MNQFAGAIVFLPRDQAGTLMLENILFEPALAWLSQTLQAAGAERFLVVCHEEDRAAAAACVPAGAEFVTTGDADAFSRLSNFLGEQEGRVLVLTTPSFSPTRASASCPSRVCCPGARAPGCSGWTPPP